MWIFWIIFVVAISGISVAASIYAYYLAWEILRRCWRFINQGGKKSDAEKRK